MIHSCLLFISVPLLKGRKRKKLSFKKDSGSDTNDSESSVERLVISQSTEGSQAKPQQSLGVSTATSKPSTSCATSSTTVKVPGLLPNVLLNVLLSIIAET